MPNSPDLTADYVIVGAGSAGCALAGRLTEDEGASVVLLEAGGWDRDPLIHIPIGWGRLSRSRKFDWGYMSEPMAGAAGRRVDCLRGKVVGGSSSVNAMAYVRGHRADFDRLAERGLRGWSYDEVLPYFRRQETWEGGPSPWRGGDGPLRTCRSNYEDPLVDAYAQAALSLGYRWTEDYNGPEQEGFSRMQLTVGGGRRASTAVAYLRPALGRSNLKVEVRAHVTRIRFEGRRATGIEYVVDGRPAFVAARREVVLCAGTFNSPQILMLSGIGDPDRLRAVGIGVNHALPGVGANLHEHAGTSLVYARRAPGPFHANMRFDRAALGMIAAHLFGRGFATRLPGGLTGFVRSTDREPVPDIQLLFLAAPLDAHPWFAPFVAPYADRFVCRVVLVRPESRGLVDLVSDSPFDPPRIHQNLMSAPEDVRRAAAGVSRFRAIGEAPPLQPIVARELAPGAACRTREDVEDYVRGAVTTSYHPAGTCRMGLAGDAGAVVDAALRVHGLENLRVVDGSVFPEPIGGNINAAIIMAAERASDLIRGRQPPAATSGVSHAA
jgi:4-pyridoxate dehydrogenase